MQFCRRHNNLYLRQKPRFCARIIKTAIQYSLKVVEDNYATLNFDKFYPFVSGNKYEHMWANIGDDKIWESKIVKLLGITTNNKLKFDEHISKVCIKTQRKVIVLMRIRKYRYFNNLRILIKIFFESQLKHCSLRLMFCFRNTNNKMIIIHYR